MRDADMAKMEKHVNGREHFHMCNRPLTAANACTFYKKDLPMGLAWLQMVPTLKLIHLGKQPLPKNISKSPENNKIILLPPKPQNHHCVHNWCYATVRFVLWMHINIRMHKTESFHAGFFGYFCNKKHLMNYQIYVDWVKGRARKISLDAWGLWILSSG